MKSNFKLYFQLILGTALFTAFAYGFAQTLVEQNITVFSFALLAVIVYSIAGMMRSLAISAAAEANQNNE